MHAHVELTEIALAVVTALGFGLLFEKIKQPAVLGYILAGAFLGPSALGLIENRELVHALAELGILMLLFLVGMELDIRSFKNHWWISVLTTLAQLFLSTLVTFLFGKLFGLPLGLSLILGCAIALSSTAVAIKMLEGIDELSTKVGQISVGILIAQDLAIIPMILLVRGFSTGSLNPMIFTKIGFSVVLLGGLIWYLSRREKISFPYARYLFQKGGDLEPLTAMVFCFGAAAISGLLGLSAAYGAFLGGLILGNTQGQEKMVEITRPIQSVLIMAFFLSIGLLMDFHFIWDHLGQVLILLVLITIGKTALNISILHGLKLPWEQAFLVGLILSQVGEFAFLLASLGINTHLIDENGHRLIVSLTVLSLSLSPFWMMAARRLHEAAPKKIISFQQLIESVYGPQMGALKEALKALKKGGFLLIKALKIGFEKLKSFFRKTPHEPS